MWSAARKRRWIGAARQRGSRRARATLHGVFGAAALGLLLLIGLAPRGARAVESFLDGNPKAPEARPYPRRVAPTPLPTPATPAPAR